MLSSANAERRRLRIQYAESPNREAASLDLELDVLNEAHIALLKAEELNPGLEGPIDGAVDRQKAPESCTRCLSTTSESSSFSVWDCSRHTCS